jgi:hypothetical protein
MSREFEPVRSLPEVRFALYKGHFAGNHLWESLGRSGDRRFQVDGQKPARNPRTGPEVKSGTKAGLKRKHLIRFNQDRPPASRMAREPRTRLDSREPALKPWLNSEIRKCKDDPGMSCGRILWDTGAKFFKRILKNFEKVDRLSASRRSLTQGKRRKKSRTLHRPTLPYTGAKFFYLQEARKICLTLHTGANFSIFVKKNWKNSESHSNGPREASKSQR